MMTNLSTGLIRSGLPHHFVVKKGGSPYLSGLPRQVRLIELDTYHKNIHRAAALYLLEEKPGVLITSKEENDIIALRSRDMARTDTGIVMRVPVHVTSRLKYKRRGTLYKWMTYRRMRKVLTRADRIVAVSEGVALDISSITGLPPGDIRVIHNPVVTRDLEKAGAAPVNHPWLSHKEKPVLVSIGRLGSQKNFEALIRAFKIVTKKVDCRLLIIGEGRRRARLEKIIHRLDLTDRVRLPGFIADPYPYLAKADLFVLSSLWEGSPNALAEALALGTPVVATDCQSGPGEILQNGKYGSLTAVGDIEGLASAIILTLAAPPDAGFLKKAVQEYTVDSAARSYLDLIRGMKEKGSRIRRKGPGAA